MNANNFSFWLFCLLTISGCTREHGSTPGSQTQSVTNAELVVFDKAQKAWSESLDKEAALCVSFDPHLAAFLRESNEEDALYRKLERKIFIFRQQNAPDKIDWSSPYFWGEFSSDDYEVFKKTVPGFRELAIEFESKKAALNAEPKSLSRERNQVMDAHRKTFSQAELEDDNQMMKLQKEMNEARHPTPGSK